MLAGHPSLARLDLDLCQNLVLAALVKYLPGVPSLEVVSLSGTPFSEAQLDTLRKALGEHVTLD